MFELIGGVNPTTLWWVIAVAVAAGAATTVGFGGRFSVFVTLQTYMALAGINPHIGSCDDQLIGTSTSAPWFRTWERLNASADGLPIEDDKLEP